MASLYYMPSWQRQLQNWTLPCQKKSAEEKEKGDGGRHNPLRRKVVGSDNTPHHHVGVGQGQRQETYEDEKKVGVRCADKSDHPIAKNRKKASQCQENRERDQGICHHVIPCSVGSSRCFTNENVALLNKSIVVVLIISLVLTSKVPNCLIE